MGRLAAVEVMARGCGAMVELARPVVGVVPVHWAEAAGTLASVVLAATPVAAVTAEPLDCFTATVGTVDTQAAAETAETLETGEVAWPAPRAVTEGVRSVMAVTAATADCSVAPVPVEMVATEVTGDRPPVGRLVSEVSTAATEAMAARAATEAPRN